MSQHNDLHFIYILLCIWRDSAAAGAGGGRYFAVIVRVVLCLFRESIEPLNEDLLIHYAPWALSRRIVPTENKASTTLSRLITTEPVMFPSLLPLSV